MGIHDNFPDVQSLDLTELSNLLQGARSAPFKSRDLPNATDFTGEDISATEEEPEIPEEGEIEVPDPDAIRAEAHKLGYTEGFAEGYQKGKADASTEEDPEAMAALARMNEAAETLAHLTAQMLDQSEAFHTQLKMAVEKAVSDLASELAGSQIDFMPEGYAHRIEEMVNYIKSTAEDAEIVLNPEDLNAVSPALDHSDALDNCTLRADDDMPRGSLDIRSGPNRLRTALPTGEEEASE